MKHTADRFTVLLDANVLYPFVMRDVLLSFAEAGLFRARWSEEIMDEWSRNLLKNNPHLEIQINRTAKIMKEAFPEALVSGHETLIPSLELPDKNDHHVLAAAIKSDAQHIVTQNLKHFPNSNLEPYGIEAKSADDFLLATFELYEIEATLALREMRSRYENPSKTKAELIQMLSDNGMPQLAAALKSHIESL